MDVEGVQFTVAYEVITLISMLRVIYIIAKSVMLENMTSLLVNIHHTLYMMLKNFQF